MPSDRQPCEDALIGSPPNPRSQRDERLRSPRLRSPLCATAAESYRRRFLSAFGPYAAGLGASRQPDTQPHVASRRDIRGSEETRESVDFVISAKMCAVPRGSRIPPRAGALYRWIQNFPCDSDARRCATVEPAALPGRLRRQKMTRLRHHATSSPPTRGTSPPGAISAINHPKHRCWGEGKHRQASTAEGPNSPSAASHAHAHNVHSAHRHSPFQKLLFDSTVPERYLVVSLYNDREPPDSSKVAATRLFPFAARAAKLRA